MRGTGYAQSGASYKKKALKAFIAVSQSAQSDIDDNNYTLRQRARALYMSGGVATSSINTYRTNVVGLGLILKPHINAKILGLSQEEAETMNETIEEEFKMWASKKNACDSTGVNDFYAMQQLALMSWLMSGDVFALIKRKPATRMKPYTLRLQLIEADLVSTPGINVLTNNITEGKADNGNRIYDGVEIDDDGMIVAYYFTNHYPYDANYLNQKHHRVEAYGKETELPNVLHVMASERPGQYRGVTLLAQVIEPMLQIRRYTEAELMAAIIESFFTAYIMTENPEDNPFDSVAQDESFERDESEYAMGPGQINFLKPNESITFGDPKRPASGFDAFVKSLCIQMGASLEIPKDVLLKEFNASYSASRAALLELWKAVKMKREWFVNDFCKPVYEVWFSEAVALGRIKAPGFFDDPIIHEAWLSADWIGPSQGMLDPVKEITAEQLACENGFSTRVQSTIRLNGGSWDSNIEQCKTEAKKMNELNDELNASIDNQDNENVDTEENEEEPGGIMNEQ